MTTFETPPTQTQRLVRSRHDGMLAGVCTAFGRYTNTDPVIWRVLVVVLTFFGGTGALVYLIGWLLIPCEGEGTSLAERLLHRHGHGLGHRNAWLVFGLVIALVAIGADHAVLWPLAVLGGVAYLVFRERSGRPLGAAAAPWQPSAATPVPPSTGGSLPTPGPATLAPPPTSGTGAWGNPPPPPRKRPRPPKVPSRLGRATLSLAVLTAGILILVGEHSSAITASRVIAATLLVVGLGLVVGTWFGRSRVLILVGATLVLALGPTAVTEALPGGGTGNRYWAPVDGGHTFELTAGDARLDLSGLTQGQGQGQAAPITARVGLGHLVVNLPPGSNVVIHAHVAFGGISVDGEQRGGVDVSRDVTLAGDATTTGATAVVVTLRLSVGQLEVRHV
ncbi:MAG: PspC domain-containing protein [Actinomycetota bacterium]|nr:PspC domain-containing protein [Actinomycetota bacterium]